MQGWHGLIAGSFWLAVLFLAGGFALLARCADLFVDGSVSLARRFRLPRLVVGLVLVSLATTVPEITVSALAAWRGQAEMALGNAVGSIICNTGLGLALAALASAGAIAVLPAVFRLTGAVFLLVAGTAFAFTARDATLSGAEGAVLLGLFGLYVVLLFIQHRRGRLPLEEDETAGGHAEWPLAKLAFAFAAGLAGILVASDVIVTAATRIAQGLGVPSAVIALTLVAFGTSVPEFATCVTAARKGHGALAVGNILGANIMNICWVAGASSLVNSLTLTRQEIYFMFPAMFVIVGIALLLLRGGYRLTRAQGLVLLGLYVLYLVVSFALFRPTA